MIPPSSPRAAARAAVALLATVATVAACAGDRAPTAPAVEPRSFTAAPDLLAALADADQRVVPALGDSTRRAALHVALTELAAALDGGQAARTRRALARLDELVGGTDGPAAGRAAREVVDDAPATPPAADAADAAAVLVTTALVRQQLDAAAKAP